MKKPQHMFFSLVCAATIAGALGLCLVIFRMSPLVISDTAWLSWSLFFLSSFVFFAGICTLVGGSLRLCRWKDAMYFYQYVIALRQGILLSLFFQAFFALNALHVVTWWNLLFIMFFLILIELFFLNHTATD